MICNISGYVTGSKAWKKKSRKLKCMFFKMCVCVIKKRRKVENKKRTFLRPFFFDPIYLMSSSLRYPVSASAGRSGMRDLLPPSMASPSFSVQEGGSLAGTPMSSAPHQRHPFLSSGRSSPAVTPRISHTSGARHASSSLSRGHGQAADSALSTPALTSSMFSSSAWKGKPDASYGRSLEQQQQQQQRSRKQSQSSRRHVASDVEDEDEDDDDAASVGSSNSSGAASVDQNEYDLSDPFIAADSETDEDEDAKVMLAESSPEYVPSGSESEDDDEEADEEEEEEEDEGLGEEQEVISVGGHKRKLPPGISLENVVHTRRQRRKTKPFVHPDHKKYLLADIPADEYDAAVVEDVDDEDSIPDSQSSFSDDVDGESEEEGEGFGSESGSGSDIDSPKPRKAAFSSMDLTTERMKKSFMM